MSNNSESGATSQTFPEWLAESRKRSEEYKKSKDFIDSIDHREDEARSWHLRGLLIDQPRTDEQIEEYISDHHQNVEETQRRGYKYMDDTVLPDSDLRELIEHLNVYVQYEYGRDDLSHLAMSMSLCPIHFVDWAICFDDEPEDCSQVRAIFPYGHDT